MKYLLIFGCRMEVNLGEGDIREVTSSSEEVTVSCAPSDLQEQIREQKKSLTDKWEARATRVEQNAVAELSYDGYVSFSVYISLTQAMPLE